VPPTTRADSQQDAGVSRRRTTAARLLPRLALVVVLLGGLAIRLDFAHNAYYFKDDHGTAALMSLHIMQGREFPVYFYGWFYIAAIPAYVGAAMFAVFGVSVESLCLAMTLFTLLWVFATYLLFSRLISRWAGVLAAALVAFAPYNVMWYSVIPLLGYPPTFAFGTLILYFGVRLNERECSARAEWWCLLGMGALAGIAIWTNPLCTPYLVVGVVLLAAHIVRRRFNRALLIKLAVAFLVLLAALTPVIATAAKHGLGALFGFRAPHRGLVEGNIVRVYHYYLEKLVLDGFKAKGAARWPIKLVYLVPLAVFVGGWIAGIVLLIVRKKGRLLRAALVPLLFAVVFLALFLPSPMATFDAPRYFVPFYLGVCAIFAFPLVFRRTWITTATVVLAVTVMVHNVAVHVDAAHGPESGQGAARMAEMRALVEDVKAAGLRHVMVDDLEGQTLTFVAREDVVFAQAFRERYYPYGVAAAADDRTGISKHPGGIEVFNETLRSMGVTAAGPIVGARQAVFYDFVLPTEGFVLVEPKTVTLVGGLAVSGEPGGMIDGNDETAVGNPFDMETALVVDFGEAVSLSGLRLVARHEWEYPAGLTLSGLLDEEPGEDAAWFEVEKINAREGPAYIAGNRLYHRGHFTAMECRFPAKRVRYLKVDGFRAALPRQKAWKLHEVYFYSSAGETGRPDEQEAAEIARTLAEQGVELAFCDEWLSRKIEALAPPRPAVLPHYDPLHPQSQVAWTVPIRGGVAVVAERAHAAQCRELLEAATLGEVTVETVEFPHYVAHVIADAPRAFASFPGVKWDGFTLVGTNRIAAATWYSEQSRRHAATGQDDLARMYDARAFETFPGIPGNLERVAAHDARARAELDLLTPAVETPCAFTRGLSLVGYTLDPARLVPGETATLRLVWEIEGPMPHNDLSVFVHFVRGDRILFQADHYITFPIEAGSTVPHCLILDEQVVRVPVDCPTGKVAIRLGALKWTGYGRRLKPRTTLPKRDRAVELGTVEIGATAAE